MKTEALLPSARALCHREKADLPSERRGCDVGDGGSR